MRAAVAALAALAAVACGGPRAVPATRALAPAPAFTWVGTWELRGSDFPDGPASGGAVRVATLVVARQDTAHAVVVHGPPGLLDWFRLAGDSAQFQWDFLAPSADHGRAMSVRLRAVGDSVEGRWVIDDLSGPIVGRRLR
ncbi:hypothetical protein [Roseisolibacter sp. H3M3-2]|uniref:hypothetical protein n=1 Tax=Roseisolibacter sp. H3M3-2 TaxID=3031323 RepID=UPI0023DAD43A|nr:hypothetical protein [Roseisolibacter sp. H3M3-2]MDF1505987.1 hypothetical protein [Roseisolibacter sp. H3M3-2]